MDYGHKLTEKELKELEKRITKEYETAEKEVQDKLFDYMQNFKSKDADMQAKMEAGKISQTEYNNWRVNQMATGKRWEEMRNSLAEDFHNTNNIAKEMTKEHSYDIYALNHNYGTYEIEKGAKVDTSYTLYNRATVERLVRDNPQMLPPPGKKVAERIRQGKDVLWNNQQIQSVMVQGLLQGMSIPELAERLAETVGDKDKVGAIRNARTMTTGAQNAGRVDSYKRAVDMGIKTKQRWIAVLDEKTRHSHRQLDGEMVDVGEKFSNGCRFPGDPSGAPEEVYNCRCTLIAAIEGTSLAGDIETVGRTAAIDMDYEEWKKGRGVVKENLYMRFGGGLPPGEKSINWLALPNTFLDENQYLLTRGMEGDIEEFYNMIPDYAFESGISAWKMGADGYPEIDNLQGLCTLANFANSEDPLNILKGTVVGQGNDNEPTLKDVSLVENKEVDRDDMKQHIYDQLCQNFDTIEGEFNVADAESIFESVIWDDNFNEIGTKWTYGGVTFTNPHSDFDTRLGIKDKESLEERKKEYQERMRVEREEREKKEEEERKKFNEMYPYQWQRLELEGYILEPFVTKSGKEAFKYVENGVLKTIMADKK